MGAPIGVSIVAPRVFLGGLQGDYGGRGQEGVIKG